MISNPKCVFCDDNLYGTAIDISNGLPKNEGLFYYICANHGCFVHNDFPRYKISIDGRGTLFEQEYAFDDFYVKVFPDISLIYRLEGCMLTDEVRIPRALWLNPTNIPQ